jgi:hypothetical protein
MEKQKYTQFQKALKRSTSVSICVRCHEEFNAMSLSTTGIATVTLRWMDEGADCTYNCDFPARIEYYADDYETVGKVTFVEYSAQVRHVFALSKEGDVRFNLSVGGASKLDHATITADIFDAKEYLTNVPVAHSVRIKGELYMKKTPRKVEENVAA